MSADRKLLPLTILIASAAIIGLAPIFVRLTETGPAAAGFWRLALAVPMLLAITARPGGEGVGRPKPLMALAGLFFVLDLSFWHYGVVMTSVANATVLCNLTPLVVTAFAWVVFKERPRAMFLVALAVCIAGALAMAAGADGRQGTHPRLGDLFSVSVALWYGGYFLCVKAARRTAGAGQVMLWSTAIGAPLVLLVSLALGESVIPASLAGWGACLGLAVVHVAGQGGVAWALGRLPASVTAVVVLIQPVVAGLLGWVIFKEAMTAIQMAGGAAVLAGVVMAQRAGVKTRTGAAAEASAPAKS